MVLAIETGYSATVKAILSHYRVIVYEIPHDLCSKATRSIFCGNEEVIHISPQTNKPPSLINHF
jgi:hypothetical protein